MTMNAAAIRGTCAHCGRYVASYPKKDDNERYAAGHKSWQQDPHTILATRIFVECPGSNRPIKAGS